MLLSLQLTAGVVPTNQVCGLLTSPPGRIRWLIGPECCVAGSEQALDVDAAGSGAPSGAARTRSVAPCATGAGNVSGRRKRVRAPSGAGAHPVCCPVRNAAGVHR